MLWVVAVEDVGDDVNGVELQGRVVLPAFGTDYTPPARSTTA